MITLITRMMFWKKLKWLGVLSVFVFFSSPVHAQEFWDLLQQERVKFSEVQAAAEAYFATNPSGKASGYKLYKRWEYWAQRNLNEQGYVISIKEETQAMAKFSSKAPRSKGITAPNGNWKELGPFNWTRTSSWSPGLGRITAIAVEPTQQQLIFAGSPGGGLWRSTDAGASWTPLGDDFANMFVWSIEIDPTNSNVVYYGNSQGEVWRSMDQGDSWTLLTTTLGQQVRDILIHPTQPQIIMLATFSGVFRSTNGGTTFSRITNTRVEDLAFQPGTTNVVYASGSGFFRSTNGGSSFTEITGFVDNERMKMAVTPANPSLVYLIQKEGNGFGRVYRSTDAGLNFTIQNDIATDGFNFLGSQAWRDMAIMVSDTDPNEVHIGGLNHYRSFDGGESFTGLATWSAYNDPSYIHADIEVFQYIDGVCWAGTDGGIYRSTDRGDNYEDLTQNGLNVHQIYRIGNAKTDSNKVSLGSQDNGTMIMGGDDRQFISWLGADGMETFFDYTNGDVVYGTHQTGGLYKSTDGGQTQRNLQRPETQGNWVTPFEIDPFDPNSIYVGYSNVYRHPNGGVGSQWENKSSTLTSIVGSMDEIAIAGSNNQIIYIADGTKIYRTADGLAENPTWSEITPSGNTGWVNYLHVDPNDEDHVLAAARFYLYESKDGGATWTEISSNLPAITVETAIFDNGDNNGIYAGLNNSGVYYTNDDLVDWIPFNTKLPNVAVTELEIDYVSEHIRVATYGRGLWESPLYSVQPIDLIAPIELTLVNSASGEQTLSWTNQSTGESGHRIEVSTDGVNFEEIGGTGYSSFVNTDLTGQTTYYYRVRSFDVLNNFSIYSQVVSLEADGTVDLCTHIPAYDNNVNYSTPGTMVQYLGSIYINNTAVQGFNPRITAAWDFISWCNASGVKVTATSGANGAIIPEGDILLPFGGNFTFSMAPDNGYQVLDVTVDGLSQGAINDYTFTDLQANHTINVNFEAVESSCDEPAWDANTQYPYANTLVTHNNKLYRNRWWTQGNEPGIDPVNGPWEVVEFCDGTTLDCSSYPDFQISLGYTQPGTHVVYNGGVYANRWYAQWVAPDKESDDTWYYVGPCSTTSSGDVKTADMALADFAVHILVWPNPTATDVNVDFDAPVRNASLELINAAGQVIERKVLMNGTMRSGFRTADLPAGIYQIRATGDYLYTSETVMISK